jgi:Asp-tRNA(Asn)/Glu-tRNA(Gln) amidotransferase A subunit family amidase
MLVGIKPTVGLVSGRGVIPIVADQDIAGPTLARTLPRVRAIYRSSSRSAGCRTPPTLRFPTASTPSRRTSA